MIERQEVLPPNVVSLHARSTRPGKLIFEGVHISPQPDELLPVIDWDSDLWQELAAPRGMSVWAKINREQDTAEADREHAIALKVVGALAVCIVLVALLSVLVVR